MEISQKIDLFSFPTAFYSVFPCAASLIVLILASILVSFEVIAFFNESHLHYEYHVNSENSGYVFLVFLFENELMAT